MKKGFTLIELLAVIVILAIIALIATPIVLNIIDDTKESATLRSADFYMDAVEYSISREILNGKNVADGVYNIMSDGNICLGTIQKDECTGEILEVEVKGEKPETGTITISSGQIIYHSLTFESITIESETIIETGKIYTYGNYEYRYNQFYNGSLWQTNETQNGWGVRCINNIAEPGEIYDSIDGKPVTNMNYAFYNYNNLEVAPTIPNTVINMDHTFYNCSNMGEYIYIPKSVKNMNSTLANCRGLWGIDIDATPTNYANSLEGIDLCQDATISGKSLALYDIILTASSQPCDWEEGYITFKISIDNEIIEIKSKYYGDIWLSYILSGENTDFTRQPNKEFPDEDSEGYVLYKGKNLINSNGYKVNVQADLLRSGEIYTTSTD